MAAYLPLLFPCFWTSLSLDDILLLGILDNAQLEYSIYLLVHAHFTFHAYNYVRHGWIPNARLIKFILKTSVRHDWKIAKYTSNWIRNGYSDTGRASLAS